MINAKKAKAVTSIDVAKRAGVSQATVSRAFSIGGNLTEKTRQKVFQAAKELGYQPNALARSLVSSKSNLIGIVKGYTTNPAFVEMLSELTHLIQAMGMQVLYFEGKQHQDIDEVLMNVVKYQVEGIILLYANLSSEITISCQQRNIPVLQAMRYSTNTRANLVLPDNFKGAGEAVVHLASRGFKHFGYITGELNSSTNLERQSGFLMKLQELGFLNPVIVQGDYTYESGRVAMRSIVDKCPLPCGVVCASDMMALGAIDALKYDLKLRVPEDVGVLGFDDIFMAAWPPYSLTSMRQPIADMAQAGMEILCRNIAEKKMEPVVKKFDPILVKRDST